MSTASNASPWQPLAAPSGTPAPATERLQKGPNQPVESDESVSGVSAALHSWHLTAGCPPGPALPDSPAQGAATWTPAPLGQASCTQASAARESWGSSPEPRPTAVEGSWGQVPTIGTGGLLGQRSPYLAPPASGVRPLGPAVSSLSPWPVPGLRLRAGGLPSLGKGPREQLGAVISPGRAPPPPRWVGGGQKLTS